MRSQGNTVEAVERFELDAWVDHFQREARRLTGRKVSTPRGVLKRSLSRLLEELESPCMLALVLEELLGGDDSFIHVVGPSEQLLTVGVATRAVQRLGGYEQPWEALYYRRFARTEAEAAFFAKWLDLLEDARTAVPGSEAVVGTERFVSWGYVETLARVSLDRAVQTLRRRFAEEGPQEEHEWVAEPLKPSEPGPLVSKILERQDSATTR